jgi:uncharacterized protein YbbC (DUF1343 family)
VAPLLLASAIAQEPVRPVADVLPGIDVLERDGFTALKDRKVGLITNHTGRTADGRRTIDVLSNCGQLRLVCVFAPEHGPQGRLDDVVAHGRDEPTGLPVWSLYGETRQPTDAMLQGGDTLVFDVQDIGCRFYTYVSTMALCLQAAAAHGLRFCVLDRPNPIDGVHTAGPLLDAGSESFVGCHTIPVRHGLTAGELMRLLIGEKGLQVAAEVVPCRGWERAMTYDRTGLPWIDPSPNMRSLTQALLYPGIGLLEGTNLSVGRGTDSPFERVGAPWCDGRALAAALRALELPGVAFVPIRFSPTSSKFAGQECSGVQIAITDWQSFEPVGTGLAIACALRDRFAGRWEPDRLQWLLKSKRAWDAFAAGRSPAAIAAGWQQDLTVFRMRAKPFLLYR